MKELSEITDQDAIEIADIINFRKDVFLQFNIAMFLKGIFEGEKNIIKHKVYQYLQSRGYNLPVYYADESAKRKDELIEKMAGLLVSCKIPIQAVIDTAPKGMLTEVENLLSRIDAALQAVKKEGTKA